MNRASNSFADIYITIFNTEKSLLVYFAQPKKQNEYFLLSAIEKTTFVFQHGWHVLIKVLMYWNPDFFMCSCAYYVWLWMTFPSLSYFFHLSLFPSFSSSKCNCWKVKKTQFSMGKCICNIQLYCAVTIHQLRLLVLVQHTFDVHKTSDSDSIFLVAIGNISG